MSLYLRPALPKDEVFLRDVVYENMYEQLCAWAWDPAIREPLMKIQVDGQRAAYASAYPRADHGIIMFEERPIGRLIVDRTMESHYLVDIVVQKKHRGKGIGTVLLRALCMEAEMSKRPMRLQVQLTNRAKELYLRLGFRMIEDKQIAWVMERAVGAASLISLQTP
jgi:GNAT superfamily N-acetyltransferase